MFMCTADAPDMPAGTADRLQHQRGFGHAKAGAAIIGGHGDAKPAGLRQCLMKFMRKAAAAVPLEPIRVAELPADFLDRRFDGLLVFGKFEVHVRSAAYHGPPNSRARPITFTPSSVPKWNRAPNSAPIQADKEVLEHEFIFT
jgi:hypothetical protein